MTGGEVFLCVFIVALCIGHWRDCIKYYDRGYNDGVRNCVDVANEKMKDCGVKIAVEEPK